MEKIIRAEFKLRGTEKEIERVRARIAALSTCEEVISMYMGAMHSIKGEKKEKWKN